MARGGIKFKYFGQVQPVGVESEGEGLWRILGLALSIVAARGGVLLVDRIDTGLHHSAMVRVWQMVFGLAQAMNVQVFATAHSSDCWQGLSEAAQSHRLPPQCAFHRLEPGRNRGTTFHDSDLKVAASRGIEIR